MNENDPIVLTRDVDALLVPDGIAVKLKAGNQVRVVQTLDNAYTVKLNSGMARIARIDADALGLDLPGQPAAGVPDEELVWKQLRNCYDPEIPVNIVDLGLVYDCRITPAEDGTARVEVRMTLTAPGCSLADSIKYDVEQRVMGIPGVKEAVVELVWDPPWNQSMMTEAARLELGLM